MVEIKVWDSRKTRFEVYSLSSQLGIRSPFELTGKVVVMVGEREIYLCDNDEKQQVSELLSELMKD